MEEGDPKQPEQVGIRTTLLVLCPLALGYFLAYVFRAVNAIIEADLVSEIGLGPAELGLVTAAYLGAFALFQLPLGVLLDRFGPRRVQASLLMIAASGGLIFAFSQDVETLVIGRALIGLGFAGGLIAGFKAVVIWVSEARRALSNALVMSAGAIGLLVATAPMEYATQLFGWRDVFIGLSGVTMLVALIIFLVVPEKRNDGLPEPIWRQIRQIGGIYKDRAFLAVAPLLATTSGVHVAIQTLWAGPWLRDVAGLDREGVALYLMLMAVAFLAGILLTGAVADWFVRRGIGLLTVMLVFLLLFLGSQVGIVMGLTDELMPVMWIVFGMLGQSAVLAFPWLASYFGEARSGRALTAANLLIFGMAFAFQFGIGAIIEMFPAEADGSYSLQSYQWSFGVALGLQLTALLWYFCNLSAFRQPVRTPVTP